MGSEGLGFNARSVTSELSGPSVFCPRCLNKSRGSHTAFWGHLFANIQQWGQFSQTGRSQKGNKVKTNACEIKETHIHDAANVTKPR